MTETIYQEFKVSYNYPVHFTHGVFNLDNQLLCQSLKSSTCKNAKAVVVIDKGLAQATPNLQKSILAYFKHYNNKIELMAKPIIINGGESHKSDSQAFKELLSTLAQINPCRHSYIIAIGGGSLLDSVGLATSLIHRGVRLIRLPSTVLSQDDGGVGVKNGIDNGERKNFFGTFAPPVAVINDFDFLKTLPINYWLGGIAEAFKVAIIKDVDFFNLLEKNANNLKNRDNNTIEQIIKHCAKIHLEHIASNGDPFEFGSARPLDFGHWAAHKLETLSNYKTNHGQAVAIGIALDSCYAYLKSMITQDERDRIINAMQNCGLDLYSDILIQKTTSGVLEILDGLEEFRIHLGGELNITLPTTIGKSKEIHKMDFEIIKKALMDLKKLCK